MIKIFGVGNSFTEDAFTWLSEIAAADGIEIMTVCPFVGGCSFKRHLDKIKSSSAEYDLIVNGKNTGKKLTFDEALLMEDWDFVTFNQGSVQSGRPISYFPGRTSQPAVIFSETTPPSVPEKGSPSSEFTAII